jgi:predicted RNA binding protein YcfA (HicA-like mRNA interferase family)
MGRIPALRANEVIRALERLGFGVTRQRGSHIRLRHQDGRSTSVPSHGSREFSREFVLDILKQAQVDVADFLEAL